MKFLSTRGGAPAASFSDVLLAGLAPDGGLYLPQSWPQVDAAAFKGARYQDVAFAILSKFTQGSFSDVELREAVEAAYSDFDAPDIAPLSDLGNGQYLLELFHGPTLAFKDIALQVLGQLFSRALAKRGGRATIVAATSGDTGSAAIAALGGLSNIEVFVLHPTRPGQRGAAPPDDNVSPHANVHNVAHGPAASTTRRALVKDLFAANRIRWHRSASPPSTRSTLPASRRKPVYYFTATAQLWRKPCHLRSAHRQFRRHLRR